MMLPFRFGDPSRGHASLTLTPVEFGLRAIAAAVACMCIRRIYSIAISYSTTIRCCTIRHHTSHATLYIYIYIYMVYVIRYTVYGTRYTVYGMQHTTRHNMFHMIRSMSYHAVYYIACIACCTLAKIHCRSCMLLKS